MRTFGFLLGMLGLAVLAWADVTVVVVDPSGARIPGAAVAVLSAEGQELATGISSPEGRVTLPANGAVAVVRAEGFVEQRAAVEGRSTLTVELSLATIDRELLVTDTVEPVATVASQVVDPARAARSDLVESLRETPHVQVLRRGGINLEPVVQGLRETQVAMVVDGTRAFAAGPARMDSELSHVNPGGVQSVEVVAGPYAITEGAGAMAAILVRSDPVPSWDSWRLGGRGGLGWRSNGSGRTAHSAISGGKADVGFRLRAAGNLLDDYNAGSAGGGTPVPGDASSHQLGGTLWFMPSETQEIQFGGAYDEQTGVDYPGRLLTAEHFLMRSWRTSYRLYRPDELVSAVKLSGFVNRKSHRMSNREKPTAMDMPGRMPPFALAVSLPAEADTVGGSARVELSPSDTWRLQAGFDFFRLDQEAQRYIARARDQRLLFSDLVWADTSLSDAGLHFLATKSFDRGEIRAAGRLDLVGSDAGRPSEYFLENSGSDLDRSETNASFSIAGRYDLGGGLALAAGTGRVVRTASALERYSDRFPSTRFQIAAEFMGDPSLRPEASLQADLGLTWQKGIVRLSAGGYVRSIADYITVAADPGLSKRLPLSPPVVYRYVNGSSARFRGWQFGAGVVGERLEFGTRIFKTIADDRELMEPVLGIAPMEAASSIRWKSPSGRFWAEYRMRNVSDQRRVSATRRETGSPGFTIHGAFVGAKLHEGRNGTTDLHLGLENLGDKFYHEHLNSLNPFSGQRIPEMGRALAVGITTAW